MQGAYARLIGALGTDSNLQGFIRAAWGADMDYSTFRDRLKDAAEIARKVADAAGTLENLLRRAEGFGTYLPIEFFSLRSLLRTTDHDSGDRRGDGDDRMPILELDAALARPDAVEPEGVLSASHGDARFLIPYVARIRFGRPRRVGA